MFKKTISYVFMFFSVFILITFLSQEVSAENKRLVFGGNDKFAPYSFVSEKGSGGFCVDLIKILSATINEDIEIKLMPWKKCLAEIEKGNICGLTGAPVYKEREPFINYSSPIAEIEFAIFVESSNHYVHSIKSLEGTLVAVNKKSLIIDELQKHKRVKLIKTDSVEEAIEKLKNHEVTAVIAEKNVVLYYIQNKTESIRGLKIAGSPLKPIYKYAIAVKENDVELLEKINQGLQIIKTNGTLDKLKRKWFGIQLIRRFPWKMVILMTSGITLLMLILAGILWVVSLNATVKSKTRQIQLMSQKMVEKDKLAVLGRLAGQIAHELRTPLSIINNSVFLLRKEGSENTALFQKRLNVLEEKIKLSSNILESILSYSRVKAEIATTVSVKECVEEVIKDIGVPEELTLEVSFKKEDKLTVFMDFHQLYSVIRNVILNALQAMAIYEGSLTIRSFPSENNMFVVIEIIDSGPGIVEGAKNKIFNLFYSTKITGTGLGLPISKSIIEANDGRLYLKETSKEGSCFVIELPSTKNLAIE